MLLLPACVAVQIIGASPAPAEVGALQSRCSGILGGERCQIADESAAPASATAVPPCWQAMVTVSERGTDAQVVLRGAPGTGSRVARRDIAFQDRDEVPERWATIGLVIAALVTIEERSGLTSVDSGDTPTSRAPEQPPPPPPPILATTIAVPAQDVPVHARGTPGVHAALAAIAVTGPLPGTAFGARAEAGADWNRFGALLRVAYYPEHNQASIPVAAGTGGGTFSLWSASAGACARAHTGRRLAMRACAGGALISTMATGFGVGDVSTTSALTSGLWAGVGLQASLTRRFAIIAEPELTLALQRPPFQIMGAGTVFAPARLGGGVALGLVMEL